MSLAPPPDRLGGDPPAEEPEPIALRIVVDGASTAGKTTTARALGERLGRPVTTPEEASGRTLLFDWMDHTGGRSDGRPIRTQVVTVPGHLPHLRARLLVTADVVLFVADTSAAGMPETRRALAQVHELLDAMPEPRPRLLIQANKRDHDDALPLDEVRSLLDLDPDELVIETVATEGDGVRQSFVYAVRLGLQHVRAVAGPRVAERQLRPEDLLAELDTDPRTIDEIAADAEQAAPPPAAEAPPPPDLGVEPELEVRPDAVTDPDGEPAPAPLLESDDPEVTPEPEPWITSDPDPVSTSPVAQAAEPDGPAEVGETPADPEEPTEPDLLGDGVAAPEWEWPTSRWGRRTPPPWRRWLDRG